MNTALQHDITVVHRSIHEFLESSECMNWMMPYLKDFFPVDVICQSTIAMIKVFCPLEAQGTADTGHGLKRKLAYHFHTEILQAFQCLIKHRSEIETNFRTLNCLESILPGPPSHDSTVYFQFRLSNPTRLGITQSMPYSQLLTGEDFLSISHVAAHFGLFEYVYLKYDKYRNFGLEPWRIVGFFEIAISRFTVTSTDSFANSLEFLESIFKRGISPNMTTTTQVTTPLVDESQETPLSVWQKFLNYSLRGILDCETPRCKIMEVLLKFGADPNVSFSIKHDEIPGDDIINQVPGGFEFILQFQSPKEQLSVPGTTRLYKRLISFLHERGGTVSLRDLINHLQPENVENLLAFLDGNIKLEQSPTALGETPLLLLEDEEPSPSLNKAESLLPSSGNEQFLKEDRLIMEPIKSNGGISSEVEKGVGLEKAQIWLFRIFRSQFAPFLVGKAAFSPLFGSPKELTST